MTVKKRVYMLINFTYFITFYSNLRFYKNYIFSIIISCLLYMPSTDKEIHEEFRAKRVLLVVGKKNFIYHMEFTFFRFNCISTN